jgi:hypothetical protein
MATIQELEAQIARARAEENRLQAEVNKFAADRERLFAERAALGLKLREQSQIIQDPNATEAQKNAAVDRATAIENEANAIGRQISQSSRDEQAFIDNQINPAVRQRQDLERQLTLARQQAATQQRARDDAGNTTVNSGATVTNAQTARDSGANPVLPVGTPLPPLEPTNANPTPTSSGTDLGTNGRLRPTTETQSTDSQQPPGQGRPVVFEGLSSIEIVESGPDRLVLDVALNSGRPGAGAPNDDQQQTNTTRARLDELYGSNKAPNVPESNILSKFASYTYSLSWYLVSPDAYRELISRQNRSLNGFTLLVQSAGIGQGSSQLADSANPQVSTSSGRNQFFPYDYYIDNFETQVLYPSGSESQSAAAFTELSFTLTEPNGLTLLPNLYRACEDLIRQSGRLAVEQNDTNYAAAMFCMVIKFYGYDENGVLQKPITNAPGTTDSTAVVEKFIPFVLKNVKFSVGPRMTEYTIEGVSPSVRTGLATNRGSIPQDFEFSGATVQDILVGAVPPADRNGAAAGDGRPQTQLPEGEASPPASPKADSAPRPVTNTVATGLVAALTNFQQNLLKEGKIEHADVYKIKFADNIIADAAVVPPGGLNKNRVGGTPSTTAAEQKLPEKNSIAPSSRSRSVRVGTQIVQFIDEVIRSSSYIIDQQSVVYDEKTREYRPNGKPAEQFAWFNIVVSVEQLEYDTIRKDYAYKMTFYVTPYEVPMVSEYFAPSGFRGQHKVYNWLFTGENTEVLQFEQNFDKLWTQALTADTRNLESIVDRKRRMNSREQWMRHYYAASGESLQGGEGKVFEAGANAADFLYGPNYGRIELNIVGDPGWIPNAYYEFNTNTFSSAPFWPDGTINSTASVPYFELAFNRPVDYNLNTGLIDPGQKNYFADREKGEAGLAAEAQTYVAVRCKSIFRGGRFSQELEGAWMWDQTFNEPVNQRTAQSAPVTTPLIPNAETTYYTDPKGFYIPKDKTPAEILGELQRERLNRLSQANQRARSTGPIEQNAAPAATPAQQIVREE